MSPERTKRTSKTPRRRRAKRDSSRPADYETSSDLQGVHRVAGVDTSAAITQRRAEVARAGRTGDEKTVRSFIDDAAGRVRFAVLAALVGLSAVGPEDVRRALNDEDATVRRDACELGARLPGANFVPLLDDEDAAVVEAAAFALGEVADPAGVPRLCEIAMSHPDALCREAAVAALGAIGDVAGKNVILHGLNDVPAIRRRAVIAAAVFDTADAKEAVLAHRDDRDWQVRQAVEDILGISGEGHH